MSRLTAPGSWHKPALVACLWAMGVAGTGGYLTTIGPWYNTLAKPEWQPPDWAFGPAWTIIYALTAFSGVLAWRHARRATERQRIINLFALTSLLNILWSALFFTFQRPDWALYEVGVLWLSILVVIMGLWPIHQRAALLNLPYLIWVTFAGYLNLVVVRLNAPFPT